ncbi:GerMN domain-containing protein [Paenibacillus lentus]|uniref:GerMN domain-containing protein n=1 Tax=Paenibacillus lentus TaxID=1338368 RepID=A0A3Q8S581_9BACL|nr:GerMN domain-containing protein [Paenibacillus lentus]AZK47250.1 hypothetical protein EIM92_14685 [Paenibacillus lentus]
MKKLIIVGAVLLLAASLAGCGRKPQAAPEVTPESPPAVDPNVSQGAGQNGTGATEPEMQIALIKLYFTDGDLMELTEVQREIEFQEDEDKYAAAFKQLQIAESGMFSLWEKVILNKASLADGVLGIDIQLPDEARLGSGGEVLAIDSLKATMFQFEEVQKLELTVDGEQVESLMGHVELEHPMTR